MALAVAPVDRAQQRGHGVPLHRQRAFLQPQHARPSEGVVFSRSPRLLQHTELTNPGFLQFLERRAEEFKADRASLERIERAARRATIFPVE